MNSDGAPSASMKTLLTKAETLTPHGHIECAAEAHGVARAGAIDGASLTLLAPPNPRPN